MKIFSEILKELQEQNKGYIVLIKNGIFYCGIGKDAVLMNQILNYKPVCFKDKICKCGIPVSTLSRVIPKMVETDYSYIIVLSLSQCKSRKPLTCNNNLI